ncbi:DUF5696 domain-containing protein [Paenibacillus nasutitermitis]|uniref:Uncharacterized protein n=1 Tax=Paenibacillus nasutitermitis TaxID=1652958 RepID=A0A917DNJ4_9BACL|nr:DUF5696 domain-containing protein [Paenibacillus nasutitermitis]GGD51315.1 hypothetical protein GCM10010911_06100 [Paenibacillus nasutitermitis]
MAKGIKRNRIIIIAAGAVLSIVCLVWIVRLLTADAVSAKLDIPSYQPVYLAADGGAVWQPGERDSQGFAAAAQNGRYRLSVHPGTGQLKITDLQTGDSWSSNPSAEEAMKEKVAGTLRTNVESTFIVEYFEKTKIQRQVVNALDPSVTMAVTALKSGVAVHYEVGKAQLSFSIHYEITDDGLQMSIPGKSIKEEGIFRILSIEALPFFGAAGSKESGYLFVPDGPGGLIYFPARKELSGKGYNQEVYGPEITNRVGDDYSNNQSVALPVFGMKKGEQAFLAVIAAGEKSAVIRALPSGVVSSMNTIHAKFVYRQEYDRRLNLSGRSVRVFQDQLLLQDRVVRYYFLSGKEAGYAGMARTYRRDLIETMQLPARIDPQQQTGLDLTLIGGDTVYYGGHRYEKATTFKQAEQIITELKAAGVERVRVTYEGWQAGGTLNPDKKFHPESKLGGSGGLQAFVDQAHRLGYKVNLDTDLVTADTSFTSLPPKTYGIRAVEEDVLFRYENFYLNPNISYNLAVDLIAGAKRYGIDGIRFNWLGELVFNDYNPAYAYTRDDTAYLYRNILKRTQEELGYSAVNAGNAYALPYTSSIHSLTADSSYSYAVDETVPFYPMVLHGSIPYSLTPANLRDDYELEFLKAIEYGSIPSFILTYESSRVLMETLTWGIYSSTFTQWKDDLIREYRDFEQLSPIHDQPMTDHYRRSQGVYVTEYANGMAVIVDYNRRSFQVERMGDL